MLLIDPVADLDRVASHYAGLDGEEVDEAIHAAATLAIRQCRIADAVFWSKVGIRARLLRARARRESDPHALSVQDRTAASRPGSPLSTGKVGDLDTEQLAGAC